MVSLLPLLSPVTPVHCASRADSESEFVRVDRDCSLECSSCACQRPSSTGFRCCYLALAFLLPKPGFRKTFFGSENFFSLKGTLKERTPSLSFICGIPGYCNCTTVLQWSRKPQEKSTSCSTAHQSDRRILRFWVQHGWFKLSLCKTRASQSPGASFKQFQSLVQRKRAHMGATGHRIRHSR